MSVNSEIRDRIISTADRLYQEAGSDKFPSVDTVRREAKADMNTTSLIMKEWRRLQTAAPTTVVIDVPEIVKEAFNRALADAWGQAQELANESLHVAQSAWESERQEADGLRQEMAEAFEALEQELAQKQTDCEALELKLEAEQQAREEMEQAHSQLQQDFAVLTEKCAGVEARLSEKAKDLEDGRVQIAELKEQLKSEQAVLEEEKGKSAELVGQARDLQADLDRIKAESEKWKEKHEAIKQELDELREHAAADKLSATEELNKVKTQLVEQEKTSFAAVAQLEKNLAVAEAKIEAHSEFKAFLTEQAKEQKSKKAD